MNSANKNNTALKTFFVTAFVSVLLFGVFYYLINDLSTTEDLTTGAMAPQSTLVASAQNNNENADSGAVLPASSENASADTNTNSVFGTLAEQKPNVQPKVVLAGSDDLTNESTQSTVPATGSDTMFLAFIISSLITFTGVYLLITGPRQKALAKFERRIVKELD